jgi:hypothetical protein
MISCALTSTFPIIDTALTELGHQFSDDNIAILCTVCALTPGTYNFLGADVLQPMAAHHKCNMDDFNLELRQIKCMITRKTIDNTMPDFHSERDKLVASANFVSKYDETLLECNQKPQNVPLFSFFCILLRVKSLTQKFTDIGLSYTSQHQAHSHLILLLRSGDSISSGCT